MPIREPLVHFPLFGAALSALDPWWRPAGSADAGGAIVVSEARIDDLARKFARTWQRPPTPPELDGLIQDFIREEVFYREAPALGLERDDAIIRRRLRQKVEFASSETATITQLTDQDLAGYLAAHPEAFRIEARASGPGENAKLGDSRLLEPCYDDLSESDVAKTFSADLAKALFRQPAGWTPIAVRGAGSWIAAAGLLMLGWLVRAAWSVKRRRSAACPRARRGCPRRRCPPCAGAIPAPPRRCAA